MSEFSLLGKCPHCAATGARIIGTLGMVAWAQCQTCKGIFAESAPPGLQAEPARHRAVSDDALEAIERLMRAHGHVWDPHLGHGTISAYWITPNKGFEGAGVTIRWPKSVKSYSLPDVLRAGMRADYSTVL